MKKLHRRTFLRGAGEVAIALPFLEIMGAGTARAAGTGPKRLVLLGVPLGIGALVPVPGKPNDGIDVFWPTGGETDFTMSEILKPLDPLRQDLLILKNLGRKYDGQNAHNYSHMVTGWPSAGGGTRPLHGPSIDQYIADRITPGVYKSLHFWVAFGYGNGYWGDRGFSCIDTNTFNVPAMNPHKIFFDLFSKLNPGPPDPNDPNVIKALQERRRAQSILDAVKIEHDRLKPRLGKSDRAKLDAHLTSIREIERKLQSVSTASSGALCTKPEPGFPAGAPPMPKDGNWRTSNDYWAKVEQAEAASALMIDLTVAALACDLTRVLTLEWALWTGTETYPFLGVGDNHALSHGGDPNQSIKVYNWYAKQMASLLAKLKEKQEGSEPILDNTAVVYMQELSCGNHLIHNQPILIGGKCGGYFKTGRFIQYPKGAPNSNTPNQLIVNDLHLTLIEAMGLPPPPGKTFGEPSWCKGPLPNLT